MRTDRSNRRPASERSPTPPSPQGPFFNVQLRELWLGPVLVKRLDARAVNQCRILAAFQEDGWPARIDDPLPPKPGMNCKDRLRVAIFKLNRHQPLIRFFADGSGTGIRWELAGRSVTDR